MLLFESRVMKGSRNSSRTKEKIQKNWRKKLDSGSFLIKVSCSFKNID